MTSLWDCTFSWTWDFAKALEGNSTDSVALLVRIGEASMITWAVADREMKEQTKTQPRTANAVCVTPPTPMKHFVARRMYTRWGSFLNMSPLASLSGRTLPPQKSSLAGPSPTLARLGRARTALLGRRLAPRLQRVPPLPLLVGQEPLHGGAEVVPGLLEVQLGDVVLGALAGDHPAADLGLAGVLGLAVDGPGAERHAGRVVGPGDQDGLAGREEVVGRQVVVGAEDGGGDAVAQGEGGDGVVCGVKEVEGVWWGWGWLVVEAVFLRIVVEKGGGVVVWCCCCCCGRWRSIRRRRRLGWVLLSSPVGAPFDGARGDVVRGWFSEAGGEGVRGGGGYLAVGAVLCETRVPLFLFLFSFPV